MSRLPRLCLVFVVLLQLSRGQETTKQPFLLQKIKDSLGIVHKSFHDAIEKSKLGDIIIFDAPTTSTTTEMSTTEMSTTETSTATTTEEDELSFRQIIDVPIRCRPGYDFIGGSCRKKVLRWVSRLFYLLFLFSLLFMLYTSFAMFPLDSTFIAMQHSASVSRILKSPVHRAI